MFEITSVFIYVVYYISAGDDLRRTLDMMDLAMKAGGMGCALFVTRWSNTVSDRNPLNDSCFKGAYLVKTALECLDTAALLSYWIICDQGSKDHAPNALVEGGQGLMTCHGLRKPAYYALQMLCCLRGRVVARTRNAIATMDTAGMPRILCHNYKHPDAAYFSDSANETQRFYEVAFEDLRPLKMHIGVHGLSAARYAVEEAWLEDTDCSLTAAVEAYPIPPEQMSQLQHIARCLDTAATPMAAWEPSIAPRAGMLHLHRTLMPHEVRLLTLFPARQ